ncbi:MAG: bifunctional phosphopantothenoylcysteine decarboxylase/phosphopantothenate--cysteine ligase CoaBC [Candidatus Verstraetearchaeota archaeon]|nr:bifunctional phosphopantothenoylcysteine decarboxylase/phosphopantothenate--cysteine ligase CoaBC [Candidatus Verstraetearchaeota archaeon]
MEASEIHPSKDILCLSSRLIEGKKVAMGVCGSVACIKSPEIARGLMRHGGDVWVVMTKAAQELISPALMEWATGNPVVTDLTGKIEHVALGKGGECGADVVLISPATANTISKIACGIDDTPVTSLATTAIGSGVPVLVAPAMHVSMLHHPAVQENVKKLSAMGVRVLLPHVDEGKAKLISEEDIVEEVIATLRPKDMTGLRVLVTSGPTRSYMDSIRFITNSSSGKMGVAFAKEATARGADVTLVSGPVDVPRLRAKVIKVTSTNEMMHAVLEELSSTKYDLAVMAAAPLDFDVAESTRGKLSSDSPVTLRLIPAPKILAEAKRTSPETCVIGFKAEFGLDVEALISKAKARLEGSGCDMIVANDLSSPDRGFASDTDEAYVLSKDGSCIHIPLKHKRELASQILDLFLERRGDA